jgi:thiamine-phosphate pyrophosphorylase
VTTTHPAPRPVDASAGDGARSRLATARLYLCTDAREERGDLEDFLHAALAGGVDVVQLRDKGLDVALLAGAPVVHMGQGDLPVPAVRSLLGQDPVLGRSTHSLAQAAAAEADPEVDYFCVGPLWATPTKPGRDAVGLDLLREVAASRPTTPWFAIGGVDPARLDQVLAAGAERIVVVRAITGAADPERAARELRERLPA